MSLRQWVSTFFVFFYESGVCPPFPGLQNESELCSLSRSTTSIILFSILLACVVYSLLIIGGIEINPGPITPTQDTYDLQGNQ